MAGTYRAAPTGQLQVRPPAETALVATLKILVDDAEAEAIALAAERRTYRPRAVARTLP